MQGEDRTEEGSVRWSVDLKDPPQHCVQDETRHTDDLEPVADVPGVLWDAGPVPSRELPI